MIDDYKIINVLSNNYTNKLMKLNIQLFAGSGSNSVYLYSNTYPSKYPYTLSVSWTENSYSVSGNTSSVTVSTTFSASQNWWETSHQSTLAIYWYDNYTGSEKQVGSINFGGLAGKYDSKSTSATFTVTHKSDGTLSGYAKAVFTKGSTSTGYACNSGSVSTSSSALTNIPRQANISTAPDFNDEDNPTITYSNPAGNSVSSLQACISLTGSADDVKYRDISKTGTSYTFNLTEEERNILRQATSTNSRNLYFYVRTEIGGVTYYSRLLKEFKIVNANPTFNDFEFKDINEKTIQLTKNDKNVILGYSDIKVSIPVDNRAIANKKSTMVKYRFNSIDANYSESENVEIISNKVNTGDFTVYAIDSRGNTSSKTKNAEQVISYSPLSKGNISVLRENGVSENVVLSFSGKVDLLTFGKQLRNVEIGDDLSGKIIYCQFPDNLGDELLYDEYGRVDDIQFIYSYNSELGALTGYMLSGLMYRPVSGLDYQYVSVNDEYIYNNDPTLETKTNLTSYKLPDNFGIVTGIDETSSAYKYIFIEDKGVTNSIKKAQYRYKIASSEEWSDYFEVDLEIDSNGNFNFTNKIKGDTENLGFDINNAYTFEVYVEDELSNITYTAILGSGIPHIAFSKSGVGIMGKYDESIGGLLQVGGKSITSSDTLPIGTIIEYDGDTVPTGFEAVNEDSGWLNLIFPDTSLFKQYNTFQTCQYRRIGEKLIFRGMIDVVTAVDESTAVVCKMQNTDYAPSINRYVCVATAGAEPNYGGYPLNLIITSSGELKVNYCKVKSWISLDGLEIYL